jgi:hypothetical protein
MRLIVSAAATFSLLALTGVGQAATLFSPTLNAKSSERQLRCSVLNVSNKPREVIFEINSSFFTIAGPTTRTIDPGTSSDIATTMTSSFAFCKVQAPGTPKTMLRGHFAIEVLHGGGDTEMVLSLPLQ